MSLNDGAPTMTMPVAPTGMTGGGWGGFGGDNGWWFIILFLAIFCGWGGNGNGFGNNGRNSGGVVDGYVLASDFSNIERKIDSVNQGLCDGFYQQAQLVNGANMAMANGFAQAELSRCNQQAALMQQLNAMQMQAQECCCENRAAIAQVRYDMATQACDTRNTVQNTTRDIIDAMNCGFRSKWRLKSRRHWSMQRSLRRRTRRLPSRTSSFSATSWRRRRRHRTITLFPRFARVPARPML